jgi:heptosyltransferase-2
MIWDQFVPFQLMKEKFDILINLEKIAGVCALVDMVDAWTKYGFRFDSVKGSYDGYEKGLKFINYIEAKRSSEPKDVWQQVMIELLGGVEWKEQKYIIGYQPKSVESFDVGLNFQVGKKWPTKGMPISAWQELENKLLATGFKVSWQQGLGNLYDYMDWINSCRLIISNDSLGLHMAFAYGKKVIGLFGPTDPSEIYLYDGSLILRSDCGCNQMPCWSPTCLSGKECMSKIDLDIMTKNVEAILNSIAP